MSADKFTKHLKSKEKKWVITSPTGKTLLETDDLKERKEFQEILRAEKVEYIAKKQAKQLAMVEESIAKFDPFTGEPLE